ncbi:DUF3991 and toprim domain-containing protein (plasmid) [Roseomonas sp. OT10]|nr:DUF3991 and toprim domain-containing protein [Roseomonas sp. OT10]
MLRAARAADAIREGGFGTPWFAHRDAAGGLTGFEMRGPAFRGFAKGAEKSLFQLPGGPRRGSCHPRRLVVAEAPIDALSVAAVERLPGDTLYLATGGGMGPGTVAALGRLLTGLAAGPEALLVAATDNDPAGERYATLLTAQAATAGVAYERLRPPGGLDDWNDALKRRREQ